MEKEKMPTKEGKAREDKKTSAAAGATTALFRRQSLLLRKAAGGQAEVPGGRRHRAWRDRGALLKCFPAADHARGRLSLAKRVKPLLPPSLPLQKLNRSYMKDTSCA